jgi:DNA-binding CsgD family transcriptional regulator
MYDLSKKDANGLIEIIHESLNCDTLHTFHRLVQKLKLLTADNAGTDLPYKAGTYASIELGRIFPGKNYPGPCSRTEVIMHYALPHLRQALSRATQDESRKETTTLSRREKEVLQWMSEGKCTWDISRILRITERTVYYHSQNIMHKLAATSRSHAVSIALKRGLIRLN